MLFSQIIAFHILLHLSPLRPFNCPSVCFHLSVHRLTSRLSVLLTLWSPAGPLTVALRTCHGPFFPFFFPFLFLPGSSRGGSGRDVMGVLFGVWEQLGEGSFGARCCPTLSWWPSFSVNPGVGQLGKHVWFKENGPPSFFKKKREKPKKGEGNKMSQ